MALFIALGGTSFAVVTLPRDSVGSSQIVDGAVTSAKLAAPPRAVVGHSVGRTVLASGVCTRTAVPDCSPPVPTTLSHATVAVTRPTVVVAIGATTLAEVGGQSEDPFALSQMGRLTISLTREGSSEPIAAATAEASVPFGPGGETVTVTGVQRLEAGRYTVTLSGVTSTVPPVSTVASGTSLAAEELPGA
jgi:hypothetical protein